MKRYAFGMLLCAGLMVCGAGRADAGMAKMCDVTGNGSITTLDANYVLQFTAGLRTLTPNQQLLADASGNGTVTSLDAARILQSAAGKPMAGSHCGQFVLLP